LRSRQRTTEGGAPRGEERRKMMKVYGAIAVMSGIMVITEKNTMHSVFYLVLAFVNAAVIVVMRGVDYLGLLLIIVYVGAIAILFLFVVMMINLKEEESNRTRYVPIGMIIVAVLMYEVYEEYPKEKAIEREEVYMINGGETNVGLIGEGMYTWEQIMYGSVVLLVAMIGAIVLTIGHTEGVRRQELYRK
jgi:NADH-quinone oxidoreductase subunit J